MQFHYGLLCIVCAVASLTYASSDTAWKAHDQNMQTACLKVSQLDKTKVVSNMIVFDDRVGYSALVMEGIYPQKHMKQQKGRELCLWERKTQKASVTEVDIQLNK